MNFSFVLKYNHAHDQHGRFAATAGTPQPLQEGTPHPIEDYHRDAVERYQFDSWTMNAALRDPSTLDPDDLEYGEEGNAGMDLLFEDLRPLKQPQQVYRVMNPGHIGAADALDGVVLHDPGWTSTTRTPAVLGDIKSKGDVVMHVTVPAGMKAADFAQFNTDYAKGRELHELLLERGGYYQFSNPRQQDGHWHYDVQASSSPLPGKLHKYDGVHKARQKYPAGTPGGKGGEWMPGKETARQRGRRIFEETQRAVDAANGLPDAAELMRGLLELDEDEVDMFDLDSNEEHYQPPFTLVGHGEHIDNTIQINGDYDGGKMHEIYTAGNSLPTRSFQMNELHATQPSVLGSVVRNYLRTTNRHSVDSLGVDNDAPSVLTYRGKHYLIDGHHRATADYLLGKRTLTARHADYDAYLATRPLKKARRKYPAGAAGGKGGQWMPREGTGFTMDAAGTWRRKDGTPAGEHAVATLQRIGATRGYKDIRLNPDPEHYLVAQGKDLKGRRKAWYKPEFLDANKEKKYERLAEFNKVRPQILRDIDQTLRKEQPGSKMYEAALALKLIDRTAFRPGSDKNTLAEKKAFGATNLQARHVKIVGDKIAFAFTGKKGVSIRKVMTDPELADLLRSRVSRGGRLFDTDGGKLKEFLVAHGHGDFMPKDFRTWNATDLALRTIAKMPKPKTEAAFKKAQKDVSVVVSRHLGNTPAMAFSSYINPKVWDHWRLR